MKWYAAPAATLALFLLAGFALDGCDDWHGEIVEPAAAAPAGEHEWFHTEVLEPSAFPPSEYANATCIVLHESDFDPASVNHNTNGTLDTSGWQINSGWSTPGWNPGAQQHVGLYDPSRAEDWGYSTTYAHGIWAYAYESGPTWRSWATARLCGLH